MNRRLVVSIIGILVVSAYSSLMAFESLVLDPLAAVPGQSLQQIYDRLRESGMNVGSGITSVLVVSAVGVILAVAAAVVGAWRRLSARAIALAMCTILALGAIPAFMDGLAIGMDVADTFAVSGGAHTIWAGVLYLTSLAAAIAATALLVTPRFARKSA